MDGTNGGHRVIRRAQGRAAIHQVWAGEQRLDWAAFARGLVEDAGLRTTLTESLQLVEHVAFYWECAPWSTRSSAFEFATLPAPGLVGRRVRFDFAEYFTNRDALCATFPNLGGDAELVVPAPDGPHEPFGHLGDWIRAADPEQVHACWIAVGQAAQRWFKAGRRLWLSTSGGAVPWVHIRLDSRPKYYTHAPYRRA